MKILVTQPKSVIINNKLITSDIVIDESYIQHIHRICQVNPKIQEQIEIMKKIFGLTVGKSDVDKLNQFIATIYHQAERKLDDCFRIKPPEFEQRGTDYILKCSNQVQIDIVLSVVDLETYAVIYGIQRVAKKLTLNEAKKIATELYYDSIKEFLIPVNDSSL